MSSRYGTGFTESEAILAAQAALEEDGPDEPATKYLAELVSRMMPHERRNLGRAARYLSRMLDRREDDPTTE